MDLFFSPAYMPFTGALLMLLMLGAIEILGMALMGVSFSSLDMDFLPDSDVTGWLKLKGVPLPVFLALVLGGFGSFGFLIQQLAATHLGAPLPQLLALSLSAALTLPLVRALAHKLAALVNGKDETVSRKDLLGFKGVVSSLQLSSSKPGEVEVMDMHGHTHRFIATALPDTPDPLRQGDAIQIMALAEHGVLVRAVPH